MNILKELQKIMDLTDYDERLKKLNNLGRKVGASVTRVKGDTAGGTDEEVMIKRIQEAVPLYQSNSAWKISIISTAIALLSVGGTWFAIWQSNIAKNDAKILNKLDFRPTLALQAQLKKINDKIPAHINIKNKGPIDAVQVQVQIRFLRYLPEKKMIGIIATASDLQWTIARLPPLKQVNTKINEMELNTMLPVFSDTEKHYRILEIRLNYRREVDLKEYSESAFYFVSQEGNWVGEKSNALNSDIYKPIKEAAFNRFNVKSNMLDISDTLHELSE